MALVEPRAMGRPKKGIEMASMRLGKDAYELARQACGIYGESIVEYATRIVRERAEADLLEDAKRRIKEAEKGSVKEGKKGAK